MRKRPDNALRFSPASKKGHVESYFMRANHPERPLAFWLKATIFSPRPDSTVAELWCIVFDKERGRTWAHKQTVPYENARFSTGQETTLEVAGAEFVLSDSPGSSLARGSMAHEGGCRWDLKFEPFDGALGKPLCMFPFDAMVEASFPKNKLLTPYPALVFNGSLEVWGETLEIENWVGMQGHNWGPSHAWEYAWGQCFFRGEQGAPDAWVEAFSGKIKLGGWVTPWLSGLVVRRGETVYRFDASFDFWRQKARIEDLSWTLKLKGKLGTASLRMEARAQDMVCLGYHNPDGRLSYCLNSKLSEVYLAVNPDTEESFQLTSAHGGALEFLRNTPDPRFPEVV